MHSSRGDSGFFCIVVFDCAWARLALTGQAPSGSVLLDLQCSTFCALHLYRFRRPSLHTVSCCICACKICGLATIAKDPTIPISPVHHYRRRQR